jgi:chromosome segregation ATPase
MKAVFIVLVMACAAMAKSQIEATSHSKATTAKADVEWVGALPEFRSMRATTGTVEFEEERSRDVVQTDEAQEAMFKLKHAIIQIKGDIARKVDDLQSEMAWVQQVKIIIVNFETKINNTKAAILTKKEKLKTLLKKKRQLENLLLQLKLQTKLMEAGKDMASLKTALRSVAEKKKDFQKNADEVHATVAAITQELMTLNGGALSPEVAQQLAAAASAEGSAEAAGAAPAAPAAPARRR